MKRLMLLLVCVPAFATDTPEAPGQNQDQAQDQAQDQVQDQAQSLTNTPATTTSNRSTVIGLASKSDPAVGHNCFVPTKGRRDRGFSTPVFSRPSTLTLNAECWEWHKILTAARLLAEIGETRRAVALLTGATVPTFTGEQCDERSQRQCEAIGEAAK